MSANKIMAVGMFAVKVVEFVNFIVKCWSIERGRSGATIGKAVGLIYFTTPS